MVDSYNRWLLGSAARGGIVWYHAGDMVMVIDDQGNPRGARREP